MRLDLLLLALLSVVICCVTAAQNDPSSFSRTYDSADEEEYETDAQTPVEYRTKLYNNYDQVEESDDRAYRREPQLQNSKKVNGKKLPTEEELEEEEKPDRLTVLLEQSRFGCEGKTTGYYADETLNCEVFHYCQDNQRHSWICPEGFTFHQVHLICMPPTGENICDQSSKYHIVNDYLYKPINVAEHETKPNVSLRYSERYYPESFFQDTRQDYDDVPQQVNYHKTPIQVGFNNPQPQRKAPTPTPAPQPSQSPYRFSTPQPQQVYRSPDEINISLQQRRPQAYFASPTPKYAETDYGYEQ